MANFPEPLTAPPAQLAVHRVLAQYLNRCGIRFTYAGNPLAPEQLLQPEGLLPVIAIEAMRIWQLLSHRPGAEPDRHDTFQVEFSDAVDGAFFPLAAYPALIGSDTTSTFRLLVFLLAMRRVLGLKEGQTIDLRGYVDAWDRLDWTNDTLPDIPIPEGYDLQYQLQEFLAADIDGQHGFY